MSAAAFPHAYPFRFVDGVAEPRNADFSRGRARIRVSANARASMGAAWGSPLLLAEAIAQAALLLQGQDAERASVDSHTVSYYSARSVARGFCLSTSRLDATPMTATRMAVKNTPATCSPTNTRQGISSA